MIDAKAEHLLSLTQAAKSLPGRTGRGVHLSTLWRWWIRGIRGVRLETIMIGGIRHTSQEALQRFFEATTAAASGINTTERISSQPRKGFEQARTELRKAGILRTGNSKEANPP